MKDYNNKKRESKATTEGVNSFYNFKKPEFTNSKVTICNGTACLLSGKQNQLKQVLLKYFRSEEIDEVTCLGLCHKNSAFLYNGKAYSSEDPERIEDIIKELKDPVIKFPVYATVNRPYLINPWISIGKAMNVLRKYIHNPESIIEELKISNLRGRGGAGFPFHAKVTSCKESKLTKKYVVCNGDEGDAGAFSDMYLLNEQPLKVLFGLIATAVAVGADEGIIYIRGEYPSSIELMNKAIGKLYARGFLGEKIYDTEKTLHIKVEKGQGAYICGEETSLMNSIECVRPEVRVRPPFPSEKGLYGCPTVISNVETFANIFYILQKGGVKYSKTGTSDSTGNKLVCLDSGFGKPGIYEVEMGTPLRTLIKDYAKGFARKTKAIQVGGPLGGVVPVEYLSRLNIDFESFHKHGFLLGHGGIVSIPASFVFADYIKHLFEFVANESCGKCNPCRIGAIRGYELFEKAINEEFKIDYNIFLDLLETMEEASLCALGGGISLPIKNILNHFEIELKPYFENI